MSSANSQPIIVWFRKDLRLDDNGALLHACESGHPIICLYIREPADDAVGPLGGAQEWWLHHSLTSLAETLDAKGSRLILRTGKAVQIISELAKEVNASALYYNRLYERDALDKHIVTDLKSSGLEIKRFRGQLLHDPETMKTGSGGAYRVYSPFWRALERDGEPREPVSVPGKIHAPEHYPASETLKDWKLLPTSPNWAAEFDRMWQPGEAGAEKRLKSFLKKPVNTYKSDRDRPGLEDATSLLSPHLAFGEISPARIWHETKGLQATDDVIHFRKELVWREFSYHLLVEFPKLASQNWNDKFDAFPWHFSKAQFTAWTKGLTGYPVVDAGMRQLWRHGYMHNRVRMITASFLIKDLMIDWRKGEEWFRDTLLDADPASNASNWQWVAGSGADASPFFRVFNPILQGEKFDPEGDYVTRFVPELRKLPRKYIHRPFEAPQEVLAQAGIKLGETYPKPIVNHSEARDKALAAYAHVTGRSDAADPRD